MIDLLTGPIVQLLWPFIVGAAGLIGVFLYGRSKKSEGRKEERRRADEARADAKEDAAIIRENAAKKPVEEKREDVSKWER